MIPNPKTADSLYLALAGESIDDIVKPDKHDEWLKIKGQYLVRPDHQRDLREPGRVQIKLIKIKID